HGGRYLRFPSPLPWQRRFPHVDQFSFLAGRFGLGDISLRRFENAVDGLSARHDEFVSSGVPVVRIHLRHSGHAQSNSIRELVRSGTVFRDDSQWRVLERRRDPHPRNGSSAAYRLRSPCIHRSDAEDASQGGLACSNEFWSSFEKSSGKPF